MTLHGTIQNGTVVLDSPPDLPNGTPVSVIVDITQPISTPAHTDRLTDEQLRQRRAILDEITAVPDENPGDTFSGRDHDKVLYGEP